MMGHGSRTPKRTTLWSNSTAVRFFATSKKSLRRKRRGRKAKAHALVDVYQDGHGRRRFKGNSNLRKSQSFPQDNVFLFLHALLGSELFALLRAQEVPCWIWSPVRPNSEILSKGTVTHHPAPSCYSACIYAFSRSQFFGKRPIQYA